MQVLNDSTNSINPRKRKVEIAVERSHEFHSPTPSSMSGPVVRKGLQYFDLQGVRK
jgi:hypothetical protein